MSACAPSPIASLAVISGGRPASGHIIMIVKAYVDESGTHGSPYIILAGYAATVEQWAVFEKAWPRFLAKHRVRSFHAKDIKAGKGDFAKMPVADRMRFIDQAEQLANLHLDCRFIMYLSVSEYKEHYAKAEKGVRRDSAYGMCFRGLLGELPKLVERHIGQFDNLQLIMESGHKNVGDVARIHSEMVAAKSIIERGRIGPLTFAGKDVFGLHVADAMAFAGFRDAIDNHLAWAADNVLRPPAQAVPVGNEPCPLIMLKITPTSLKEFSERQSKAKQRRRDWWDGKGQPSGSAR